MRYFILLLAFVLGACTAAPPVEPEPTDPRDAAIKYYLSKERREQFDKLLDHLETSVGQAMLEQRIPSFINPYPYPEAPLRKWISFQTRSWEGWPFISFETTRDPNDKADIRNSQGFSTWKCGDRFSFKTTSYVTPPTMQRSAKVVSLGPASYSWSSNIERRGQPEEITNLIVRLRGGDIAPDEPLQSNLSLYEIQDQNRRRVTKDEIKQLDLTFINDVRRLDLSNSKCAESH